METIRTIALAICMLAIAIFAFLMDKAKAHDWYPRACCHDKDCAPAKVTFHEDGSITAVTKFGSAKFSRGERIRPSPDGGWHACIRKDYFSKEDRGVCLFGAPGV